MSDTSNAALPTGYDLGDYTIESLLGDGGFGITYLASDKQLGTHVAIKEYFPQTLATRDDDWVVHCRSEIDNDAKNTFAWGLKQFLKEARALGQFKHHNIVRVLRFFEANGTAYMVMEYETGQSLSRQIMMQGNRLSEPALMRVFIPILNGLQEVHVAGLLHRDIKPDNIYLRTDESPMLIDFGSVRPTAQDGEGVQPITLTPAYAAIEQYPGQGQEGPWTDVYAIGASMYRCITGAQPIGSSQRYDAIRNYKPDPITPLEQAQPEGYSAFVLKCVDWAMQLYPKDRPQSAHDLQDALMGKRKLGEAAQHKPVPPPPPQPVEHDEDFVEQRPTSVDRWKIIRWSMVGLFAISTIAIFFAYPTGEQEIDVVTQSDDSEVTENTVQPLPGINSGSFTAVRKLTGSTGAVDAVAFVPGTNTVLSAERGGKLTIWDINSGREVAALNRHRHTVSTLVALGNGPLVAAGDDGGFIFIWDPTHKKVIDRLVGHSGAIGALAKSPNKNWLASGGRDGRVMIWDLGAEGSNRELVSKLGRIAALAVSPNGKIIAAGSANGNVYLISAGSGKILYTLTELGGLVKTTAFSPDGRWLAAGGLSDGIVIWSANDGTMAKKLVADRPGPVNALRFSRNGPWLFSGDASGMVSAWNADTGELVNSGYSHANLISDLALTTDGKTLASASSDKTLVLWALN